MIRQARLFIAAYISVDILLGMLAFTLAYLARFETGFFPAPKGQPPFEQYLTLMPFIGLLVPISFHLQGVYRLRRNRTRVDDFFAILVGTLLTVMIGLLGTLTTQAYFASSAARAVGAYEVSRLVWALFVIFNVSLSYAVRDLARTVMRRRFKAGLGLRRVLIAGTGELGRHVADRFLRHSEFGYKIIGFIDETNDDSQFGYRGIPLLGSLLDAERLIKDEGIDQLYVALPLDQHVNMLKLIEISNRECVDIKVIPDFLQFVTLRARLEELDGIPLINVNDVPIRGFNSAIKRVIDIGCSSAALVILSGAMTIIAAAISSSILSGIRIRRLLGKLHHD